MLINASISKAEVKHEYTESGELSDLFFAKSLFCNLLNNHEHNNIPPGYLIILQVIKGFYFFKYCEKSKLKEHLRIFLERNGFSSWEQYLYNAIKLLLFGGKSNKMYHNPRTGLKTYFISFPDGGKFDIMSHPEVYEESFNPYRQGLIHIAFNVGSKERVDSLTKELSEAEYEVISGPRVTGDGYYESSVRGFEDVIIEITE